MAVLSDEAHQLIHPLKRVHFSFHAASCLSWTALSKKSAYQTKLGKRHIEAWEKKNKETGEIIKGRGSVKAPFGSAAIWMERQKKKLHVEEPSLNLCQNKRGLGELKRQS